MPVTRARKPNRGNPARFSVVTEHDPGPRLRPPDRRDLRILMTRAKSRPWDGSATVLSRHYLDTTALTEPGRPVRIVLTYDVGHHACGWWRNSDYNQCWHLSVSWPAGVPVPGRPPTYLEAPPDAEVRAWARALFGEHVVWTWTEPPASTLDPYRRPGVAHVRLFTDRAGAPILPEGEVYDLKPWHDGTSPAKVFR